MKDTRMIRVTITIDDQVFSFDVPACQVQVQAEGTREKFTLTVILEEQENKISLD